MLLIAYSHHCYRSFSKHKKSDSNDENGFFKLLVEGDRNGDNTQHHTAPTIQAFNFEVYTRHPSKRALN